MTVRFSGNGREGIKGKRKGQYMAWWILLLVSSTGTQGSRSCCSGCGKGLELAGHEALFQVNIQLRNACVSCRKILEELQQAVDVLDAAHSAWGADLAGAHLHRGRLHEGSLRVANALILCKCLWRGAVCACRVQGILPVGVKSSLWSNGPPQVGRESPLSCLLRGPAPRHPPAPDCTPDPALASSNAPHRL